jgi:amino acid adenylation domain-containing protein
MWVHNLVSAQAATRPSAVAVADGKKQVTYHELEQRASELALQLRSLGVTMEVPVALCLSRSAELVIGALGILKAGGAYVPLDPSSPSNRLAMLLEDSGVRLVVTQPGVAEALPQGNWQKILIEGNTVSTDSPAPIADIPRSSGSNLAYIIFTSGSTGRPKGVQITHANLLNLIRWHQCAFRVTPADKATMHASPGFDASVWEIWPYLAAGATVSVVDESVRTSPERLRDWMLGNGITISFVPTALAESMLELQWPSKASLRFLLTGADRLRHYPPPGLPFSFVNNYGPTECTVVATSGVISASAKSGASPTIGKPIDHVQAYVVDAKLDPVPDGTPGELLIGGESVGRGYLNDSKLTHQKFLDDHFKKMAGGRLYRTGDLVQRLPDGQIHFLGRMDQQVKIRGYRVEPAEIVIALERHPAIQSCFVTVSDNSGETRLIAYVVPSAQDSLSASELRGFLCQLLPDYMVPSTFLAIASLPRTPSGKVDRAALPLPTSENVLRDDSFEPPESEIEQWLASFLSTLLKADRISRDDNFFNLGGHSLMGAQVIAKVQQTFDVELSLRSLFDHPSVREISSEIENLIHAKLTAMSDEDARRILEASSAESSL